MSKQKWTSKGWVTVPTKRKAKKSPEKTTEPVVVPVQTVQDKDESDD
jgi:hypothetical protein